MRTKNLSLSLSMNRGWRNFSTNNFSKPNAIIFDWDGTLIKFSEERFIYPFNKTLNKLGYANNLNLQSLKNSKSIEDSFAKRINCADTLKKAHIIFEQEFLNFPISKDELLPGALEVINKIEAQNIPIGIVSNLNHKLLNAQISKLGLENIFNIVVGSELGKPLKPSPFLLLKAINALGKIPNHKIWYIGDNLKTDIACAKAAGCTSILISNQISLEADINLSNLLELNNYIKANDLKKGGRVR